MNSNSRDLNALHQGQVIAGFKTEALYLDAADKPLGARFQHFKSGFTLDLLQIESVPQGFFWVNTLAEDDSGAAHTQEHLLLGKGNKGRRHGNISSMAFVTESAGTDLWRTYYHFNTPAGIDAFYKLCGEYIDLLLHPDYTDEEIRREVCNIVPVEKDGKLDLEEKGTVYNEMLSSSRAADRILWYAFVRTIYGPEHPLSWVSGGTPEGIRSLKAQRIRAFHKKNYRLNNMGMIVSLPSKVSWELALEQFDKMLCANSDGSQSIHEAGLPEFPSPAEFQPGKISYIKIPEKNKQKSGAIEYVWPARLQLDIKEQLLLSFFLSNIASGADTELYKTFVDSKTLSVESGATGVGATTFDDQGFPIIISLSDVAQSHINDDDIKLYRKLIVAAIEKISSLPDDSAELKSFNERILDRLTQTKRSYNDFINKPPSFGTRGYSGSLMKHLIDLEKKGGYKRSLVHKEEFAAVEKLLRSNKNLWKEYIAAWHLLDTVPSAIATRPDPDLLEIENKETEKRLSAEKKRLKNLYSVNDEQTALAKFKAAYEKISADLESTEADDEASRKLVDSPPLTLDDELIYEQKTLHETIPILCSTFESMSSSYASLALKINCIDKNDLVFLGVLPGLITGTGVIENGKPLSYEEMLARTRKEIYYISSYLDINARTKRSELKIITTGANETEAKKSIDWLKLVLESPNWTLENLPRLTDLVEQSLSSLRRQRESSLEEHWDRDIEWAYRRQENPLFLHARCFLTQAYDTQRVKWMLKKTKERESLASFRSFMDHLAKVANIASSRAALIEFLSSFEKEQENWEAKKQPEEFKACRLAYEKLSPEAKSLAKDAAFDLSQCLPDIPDSALQADWIAICKQISSDIELGPEKTLARLNALRSKLISKAGARFTIVGSKSMQNVLLSSIEELSAGFADKPFSAQNYPETATVVARMNNRLSPSERTSEKMPIFVALVNQNTNQGIVMNSAPCIEYSNLDEKELIRALSASVLGGGGAHSLFMKTWGAGLAYGNGPSWGPDERLSYYADKMPSIPDTLKFVSQQIKAFKPIPGLLDYALAQCFYSRAGLSFEQRGEAMANNMADATPPEIVKNFRLALLALRKKPDITEELLRSMIPEYGKVIPDLGIKAKDVPNSFYVSIGDEKQLSQYEEYLRACQGQETKLFRLWARDFWIAQQEEVSNSSAGSK